MKSSTRSFLFAVSLAFGAVCPVAAQMGDAKDEPGTIQRPPPAERNIPPSLVQSPEEALKSFRLQPGFRIELVAAEPLVHEPVALDFDANGRLWVVEMPPLMPDLDGRGESERKNRVVVLEDTNNDGRVDKSTLYLDGLGPVRAIKVMEHGVLVGEPPNLWFTRDTNGDGKADEKTAIATDFPLAEMNPEGGANGLLWGLDNWIGASAYGRRFRWQKEKWIESPVVTRGQWGQSMDDYGRLFTNSNSDYFRADLVSDHYPARNPLLIPSSNRPGGGATGVNFQVDSNQEVWPIRVTAGVNRGDMEEFPRKDSTRREFAAAGGPAVYRGDNFPAEFYGNYFAAEPAANVIRRSIITENDGMISGRNAYEGKEFLGSTDERFCPVNLYTAPDGTLYVVDLYSGILPHRQPLTSDRRRQMIERELGKPLGLGRIYRIVHESKKPGPPPNLSQATAAELVEHLSHPNGWWRDTARRLLIERGDKSVAARLRKLALAPEANVPVRLQALWTLEGVGALDQDTIVRVMDDPAPKLRAAAVRLSEPGLAAVPSGLVDQVVKHASDSSREVRLQVALSLGEAATPAREAALADLLRNEADSPFFLPAAISGLAGKELAFLERLASAPEWREPRPGFANVFEMLSIAVLREGDRKKIERLFQMVGMEQEPKWRRMALLNGIGSSGVRKLAAPPRELEAAARVADPELAKGAAEVLARFDWPGKATGPVRLTAVEPQLFEKGRGVFERLCAVCHQLNGRGLQGVALPLVGSKWVLGPDRILARIVLKGKIGPSGIAMPPLETLSDSEIAGALTYIRRSWGHEAPPVSPETVGEMREAVSARGNPYTEQELEALRH